MTATSLEAFNTISFPSLILLSYKYLKRLRDGNVFELIPKKKTLANAIAIEIKPTNKSLIFFPSFLAHRVTTHHSKRPRHSIAFNIIPINHYGNDDSSYDTEWIINNQKV